MCDSFFWSNVNYFVKYNVYLLSEAEKQAIFDLQAACKLNYDEFCREAKRRQAFKILNLFEIYRKGIQTEESLRQINLIEERCYREFKKTDHINQIKGLFFQANGVVLAENITTAIEMVEKSIIEKERSVGESLLSQEINIPGFSKYVSYKKKINFSGLFLEQMSRIHDHYLKTRTIEENHTKRFLLKMEGYLNRLFSVKTKKIFGLFFKKSNRKILDIKMNALKKYEDVLFREIDKYGEQSAQFKSLMSKCQPLTKKHEEYKLLRQLLIEQGDFLKERLKKLSKNTKSSVITSKLAQLESVRSEISLPIDSNYFDVCRRLMDDFCLGKIEKKKELEDCLTTILKTLCFFSQTKNTFCQEVANCVSIKNG